MSSDEKKAAAGTGGLYLVTGASGYIAGFIVRKLLLEGHRVRGTVRSLEKKDSYSHLVALNAEIKGDLEFVEADLNADAGWDAAVAGCVGVFHTASPFPAPSEQPEDHSVLVKPAVEGTLRVLKACAATNGQVKRVVLTSSVVAISETKQDHVLDEKDWSEPDKCDAYAKSKTLAEKAAWKYVEELKDDQKFELCTVNPSFVQGPLLTSKGATSHILVQRLMKRADPGVVRSPFNIVDVRDVADCHIKAMFVPDAAGKRFVCNGGFIWLTDLADILAKEFNDKGYCVPTWRVPYAMIAVMSWCDKSLRYVKDHIDVEILFSNNAAKTILGMNFRPLNQTLVDMGYSCIQHGIVPNKLPLNFDLKAKSNL